MPQVLDPAALPSLLKDGLEAPLLAALLRAALGLLAPVQPRAALALLRALPSLPRFSLALCMLGAAQQAAVRAAWEKAAAGLAGEEAAQLQELRGSFGELAR